MKLLSANDLRDIGIDYTRNSLWRLVKLGQFPKPIRIGLGRNAWIESEILDWIDSRTAERDNATTENAK